MSQWYIGTMFLSQKVKSNYNFTILSTNNKYISLGQGKLCLGYGMYDYIIKKISRDDNICVKTFNVGYKNLYEFHQFIIIWYRTYCHRWIKHENYDENVINKTVETVKFLKQNFIYTLGSGEERSHNNNQDLIVNRVKVHVNKKNTKKKILSLITKKILSFIYFYFFVFVKNLNQFVKLKKLKVI